MNCNPKRLCEQIAEEITIQNGKQYGFPIFLAPGGVYLPAVENFVCGSFHGHHCFPL